MVIVFRAGVIYILYIIHYILYYTIIHILSYTILFLLPLPLLLFIIFLPFSSSHPLLFYSSILLLYSSSQPISFILYLSVLTYTYLYSITYSLPHSFYTCRYLHILIYIPSFLLSPTFILP
jgi:hypothetical protein